ncbi:MAG: hypothetical protein WC497_01950 [Patescibacteria group bacterium]
MFEIAVGAILTQNTAWKNVERALAQLKQRRLLSPPAIIKADAKRLARAIKPSGYFFQKTKKLKVFCRWLLNKYQGDLKIFFKKPLTTARPELLSLWGIGPETADSILLYAGGKPVFVVDAYTRRLLAEMGLRFKSYDECQQWFERGLPKQACYYNELHALIVAWAKFWRVNPVIAKKIIHLQPRKKRVQ